MEKIVERGILYDFYGNLLTEHQRNMYEDITMNDMSLSEIAQEYGISRQGVHDQIKRIDRLLEEYEEKLRLIEKFDSIRSKVNQINCLLENIEDVREDREQVIDTVNSIKKLNSDIIEEL